MEHDGGTLQGDDAHAHGEAGPDIGVSAADPAIGWHGGGSAAGDFSLGGSNHDFMQQLDREMSDVTRLYHEGMDIGGSAPESSRIVDPGLATLQMIDGVEHASPEALAKMAQQAEGQATIADMHDRIEDPIAMKGRFTAEDGEHAAELREWSDDEHARRSADDANFQAQQLIAETNRLLPPSEQV